MKYAILNDKRVEAQPNLIADCPNCGSPVRSYCGNQIIHHWKHINLKVCDNWHENETEWHRNWKNKFDISFQEIVKFDTKTNEKHIADIYNKEKDLVLEFQHSPIEIKEIISRELFYKRMIWIIDLIPIKKHLIFLKSTTQIEIEFSRIRESLTKKIEVSDEFSIEFEKSGVKKFFDAFINANNENSRFKESVYISELQKKYLTQVQKTNYFLMIWKHRHKRWDFSKKPKFIDIGDSYIYKLIEFIEFGNAYIVKRYSKKYFINYYQ